MDLGLSSLNEHMTSQSNTSPDSLSSRQVHVVQFFFSIPRCKPLALTPGDKCCLVWVGGLLKKLLLTLPQSLAMVPMCPETQNEPFDCWHVRCTWPLGLVLTTIKSDDWILVHLPSMDT